jgi:hypothetical protein
MSPQQREEADRTRQDEIRSRANRAVAILEEAFIRNGSGRYVVLRSSSVCVANKPTKVNKRQKAGKRWK